MDQVKCKQLLDEGKLRPIEISVMKWEDIVNGKDVGSWDLWKNCACCVAYNKTGCDHCPIYQHTGETSCEGTPYYDLDVHLDGCDWCDPHSNHLCEEGKRLAKEMLDLLKSLV